jgi:hypothetical protein
MNRQKISNHRAVCFRLGEERPSRSGVRNWSFWVAGDRKLVRNGFAPPRPATRWLLRTFRPGDRDSSLAAALRSGVCQTTESFCSHGSEDPDQGHAGCLCVVTRRQNEPKESASYQRRPGTGTSVGRAPSVGSEEARNLTITLASVRRSNSTCGFPACSFHEESLCGRPRTKVKCD